MLIREICKDKSRLFSLGSVREKCFFFKKKLI